MENQNLQIFVIAAENRSESNPRPVHFLVKATSHREAWRVAREAARTGNGAFIRDTVDSEMLHEFPLTAGQLTVAKVLSTSGSRRGRPPKLTTNDLAAFSEARGVKIPARVRKIIEELSEQ